MREPWPVYVVLRIVNMSRASSFMFLMVCYIFHHATRTRYPHADAETTMLYLGNYLGTEPPLTLLRRVLSATPQLDLKILR